MSLKIQKIPNTNSIVIRQDTPKEVFIGTKEAIIISIPLLASMLVFMVKTGIISKKVIEGILVEVNE